MATKLKSLGEQLDEMDEGAAPSGPGARATHGAAKASPPEASPPNADNLRIWNAVCKTDPRHTKRVNQRGGFTAIDAQYQIMEATRQFGPLGEGWGYDVGDYQVVGPLIIVPVTLWHGSRDTYFGPILGCAEIGGQRPDRDAPKKAVTDAITKGLSQLGFNADVFLGRFDDNKYVAELTKEFEEPKLPEDRGRGEGEMSSSALRASLRLLVHHINGCASVADLEDILDTEDAKEVIDNCKRRFPAWWETGENMPAEFIPLKKLIDQTRRGLKELENAE
jgi:hypothetical protein